MKTHTKDFSYVCALCQKGFLGPAKLKKHLKAVHPDQEYEFETLTQRARDAPTMATLKPIAAFSTTTTDEDQPQMDQRTYEPDKAIDTQVDVGLEEVNQAICAQSSQYESSHDEDDTSDKEEEITVESPEPVPLIAQTLPPAPPLIHQSSCTASSGHVTLPSASVFMPSRISLHHPVPYNRDMVTIPNDLLSIVHGLDS